MAGGSRAQLNKPHKTRFASKATRNVHRTSLKDKKISKPDRNVNKGARAARLQRNKMVREQKRAAVLKEKRAGSGSTSPPRVVVLFGLSASANLDSLAEDFVHLLSNGKTGTDLTVSSSEYKLRTTVLRAPHGDLLACMEMAKVADLIAFVASAHSSPEVESSSYYIDSFGAQCLSVFRALGLPSTVVLIRGLPTELKKRNELKKICASTLASEFPEDCKFYPADTKDDLHKVSRPIWDEVIGLCILKHTSKVDCIATDSDAEKCTLLLTGYLRARSLSVNQLVHISGAGDYQLCKVDFLQDPCPLNLRKEADIMDSYELHSVQVISSLVPDPMKQEPLLVENLPDPLAGEQTWPTEAEMAEADKIHMERKLKKRTLPRGTSEYQAAWIIDDSDVDNSDVDNSNSDVDADDDMVDCIATDSDAEKCTLLLTGYLRARSLSVNQLVHISGAGDYQLCKVDFLQDPCPLNLRKEADIMDSYELHSVQVISSLVPDPMKQEPLLVENLPDPLAGEQTWPTEAEMAEADKIHMERKLKKRTLPRGTSEYQAAWIIDDSDVDNSDVDNSNSDVDADDDMVLDEGNKSIHGQDMLETFDDDDNKTFVSLNDRESDQESEVDSVMMEGEMTKEQIEEEIRRIKEAHAEDEEYPDEVDTPLDVPARKRFAKYRGLKSFRTSSWDPKESLPPEYARIFTFDNFTRTQKHVLAKALEKEDGDKDECIPASSYVRLHIKEVPFSVASKLCDRSKVSPVIACGLLQHESKISVLHFSIKKHETYSAPIKAKEELIFHVGFRQFVTRPIFSSDSINSDKSKMERFLHAGRFSIASIYAPISFPPLPLVVLKGGDVAAPAVAAVGSLRSIDPDRIILKKIILTGYPQRVSKKKASVRYMFHNPEDVRWFKPVEVWTKCGHRGRIKEPVGTHGAMKCLLNGVLQQSDTVCMNLFKRTYPKWPQHWFPIH
nr:PREDICTED: pre-rRNA-processing protein TSR1 homolog [Daucus carota subsp. sativus]